MVTSNAVLWLLTPLLCDFLQLLKQARLMGTLSTYLPTIQHAVPFLIPDAVQFCGGRGMPQTQSCLVTP